MENEVIKICGLYPEGFKKIEISSNPNYIFTNDSNFPPVKVWDADQNSLFVNSFIECEHYVSGGWNYNPILNSEAIYQNRLSMILVFSFGIYMLIKKKQLLKNE